VRFMKAYFISDNVDTFVGLKIAGIKGIVVHTSGEVAKVLDELTSNEEVNIIILTEKIADLIPEKVKKLKISKLGPLIVEIPDRHGTTRGENSIVRYVKESIGLKI
jgi:V/A-type H+/Na+-transporting ATPase subunit F